MRLNHATIGDLLEQAVGLHQQGRLQQAAQLYSQVIEADPTQPDALHLLGVIWSQSGNHQRGAALIKMSLQSNPSRSTVWASLGNTQLAEQQYVAALNSFERSIGLNPLYAPAHNGRGSALFALERTAESLQSLEHALSLDPEFAEAHGNKGLCLLAQLQYSEAVAAFAAALALAPHNGPLLAKRGLALCALQRYEEALSDCARAKLAGADQAEVLFVQGNALLALGRPDEVVAALTRDGDEVTSNATLLIVKGNALRQLRQFAAAAECYEHALVLRADDPAAMLGLGTVEAAAQRFDRAAVVLARLRDVEPQGNFHRGLALHSQLQILDWRDYASQVPLIVAAVGEGRSAALPLCFLSVSDDAWLQKRCAEIYIGAFRRGYLPLHIKRATATKRIRLVYLSADLLEHPIAYLMTGVFEAHDRALFEIIAVSLRSDSASATARRLERAFDKFIDASKHSDEEVAQLIAATGADIVVDLMGYTSEERPEILLRRPAPVQVSYLGIPATMGSDHIDYIVADEFVIPPQAARFYSENIAYLPCCFQANDSRRVEPSGAVTRSQLGLPETGFVWACFGASAKINPPLFDAWMRLLKSTPDSVLWLVAGSSAAKLNIRREAALRGVNPERLVLAGRENYANHLARLRLADLCLDTWPFNGGATTSDALWSGVPVVTVAGQAFAGRMSGSLLQAVGLPELVTNNLIGYERVALGLAMDRGALARARNRLASARAAGGPFDTPKTTRHIESAYLIMHERARGGFAPATFHVAAPAVEMDIEA